MGHVHDCHGCGGYWECDSYYCDKPQDALCMECLLSKAHDALRKHGKAARAMRRLATHDPAPVCAGEDVVAAVREWQELSRAHKDNNHGMPPGDSVLMCADCDDAMHRAACAIEAATILPASTVRAEGAEAMRGRCARVAARYDYGKRHDGMGGPMTPDQVLSSTAGMIERAIRALTIEGGDNG